MLATWQYLKGPFSGLIQHKIDNELAFHSVEKTAAKKLFLGRFDQKFTTTTSWLDVRFVA